MDARSAQVQQQLRAEINRLQAEVEAKLGQIQEKDAEIDRQRRELQTLRVRTCMSL